MGLWKTLEVPDWGFAPWDWFRYGHWSLFHPYSEFWLSIFILKMQRAFWFGALKDAGGLGVDWFQSITPLGVNISSTTLTMNWVDHWSRESTSKYQVHHKTRLTGGCACAWGWTWGWRLILWKFLKHFKKNNLKSQALVTSGLDQPNHLSTILWCPR